MDKRHAEIHKMVLFTMRIAIIIEYR